MNNLLVIQFHRSFSKCVHMFEHILKQWNKSFFRIWRSFSCLLKLRQENAVEPISWLYNILQFQVQKFRIWWSLDKHEPWHLGFWPSAMTHFNIIVSTFCEWFWQIWIMSCVRWVSLPHSPATAQSTVRWDKLCLSLCVVECFCSWSNEGDSPSVV
jgi:hypothetical protein